MTVSFSSPVTGAAITGLTSPTYTLTTDQPPKANAKAVIVTTLGGTQTNVRSHTISDPFSATVWKPEVPKALPPKNPITSMYPQVPVNQYALVVRKGVYIDSSSVLRQMTIRVLMDIPAGADAADAVNIKAALSLTGGILFAEGQDFSDLAILGVM
jgi:hypothetical protein